MSRDPLAAPPYVETELPAERALLGGALLDPATLPHLLALDPTAFASDRCRFVREAIGNLAARGAGLDPLVVEAELRHCGHLEDAGGPTFLATLVEEGAVATLAPEYAGLIRDAAAKRLLARRGRELVLLAQQNGAGPTAGELAGHVDALGRELEDLLGPEVRARHAARLGLGLGEFLGLAMPAAEPIIDGLLPAEGVGWLAGEEKVGKSLYALAEALCVALGEPVLGRFAVPQRRRVLFVEEEDTPRRTQQRLRALLRGHDLDPDDPDVRVDLDDWMRLSVWAGVSLDDPGMVGRLEATIADFGPAVCYLDVLRKLTTRDLNRAHEAGALLATLDRLRRTYGVAFRVVHHYRKVQGFRVGRGSQEISGSFVLGAWAEHSLFFEPLGRKQGIIRVEVQSKDGPPLPSFTLRVEAEGAPYAPTRLRLQLEEVTEQTAAETLAAQVLQAVGVLPASPALAGKPGVSLKAILEVVKRSDRPVRSALKKLAAEGLVDVVGQAAKGMVLYAVVER